jgi:hypothetical protein
MSNKYTRYLTTDPNNLKGVMGNYQHATDAFVENFYRLAPRYKFLFYAYFEIDNTIPQVKSIMNNRNDLEIPLLVKTASLPGFNYDTVTKNRYNRKKIVYKQINYEPITFAFHDDNAGIMNAMWYAYNEYFSNDVLHTNPNDWNTDNFSWTGKKYGMDTLNDVRFFKRITLYTLSRQKYNGYTLWGPKIKSWKHSELSYAAGNETLENSMVIEFEGVSYNSGKVEEGSPDNFAGIHYDYIKSPLDTPAGGNSDQIFNTPPDPDLLDGTPDFTENFLQAQAENVFIPLPESIDTASINRDITTNVVGGTLGATFPTDEVPDEDSVAKIKPMNQNNQGSGFKAPVYEDAILRQQRDARELENQRLSQERSERQQQLTTLNRQLDVAVRRGNLAEVSRLNREIGEIEAQDI